MPIDPIIPSLLIATMPVAIVILLAYFYKEMNKKQMSFLIGFLAITTFFIISPDPLFINKFYITQGDYATPIFIASISTLLLVFAIFFFRKHIES